MKTRVWDKQEDEWLTDPHAILHDGSLLINNMDLEWVTPADPDRFVIERVTGHKDQDGNELFAGDIFEDTDEHYYSVVQWSESALSWFAEGEHLIEYPSDDIRRIGNIHETPELLKAA